MSSPQQEQSNQVQQSSNHTKTNTTQNKTNVSKQHNNNKPVHTSSNKQTRIKQSTKQTSHQTHSYLNQCILLNESNLTAVTIQHA
jgi:hypothetical protein